MLPAVFSSDATLGSQFSTFDGGFTPWDSPELCSAFEFPKPNSDLNYGSADIFQTTKPVNSSSWSVDTNRNIDQTGSNCCNEPNRTVPVMDERRQRRMISNRESARRSRMRKQKQFENLSNQLNRLRHKKLEISNRLRFALFHCHRVRTENDRLHSEHRVLHRKLLDIRQILYLRQLQHLSEQFQPIIT